MGKLWRATVLVALAVLSCLAGTEEDVKARRNRRQTRDQIPPGKAKLFSPGNPEPALRTTNSQTYGMEPEEIIYPDVYTPNFPTFMESPPQYSNWDQQWQGYQTTQQGLQPPMWSPYGPYPLQPPAVGSQQAYNPYFPQILPAGPPPPPAGPQQPHGPYIPQPIPAGPPPPPAGPQQPHGPYIPQPIPAGPPPPPAGPQHPHGPYIPQPIPAGPPPPPAGPQTPPAGPQPPYIPYIPPHHPVGPPPPYGPYLPPQPPVGPPQPPVGPPQPPVGPPPPPVGPPPPYGPYLPPQPPVGPPQPPVGPPPPPVGPPPPPVGPPPPPAGPPSPPVGPPPPPAGPPPPPVAPPPPPVAPPPPPAGPPPPPVAPPPPPVAPPPPPVGPPAPPVGPPAPPVAPPPPPVGPPAPPVAPPPPPVGPPLPPYGPPPPQPQPPLNPTIPPPQQPNVQSCTVAQNLRVPCGVPGITADACSAISCCFDGQQCYYGKAVTVQCTKDAQFIVVVARDATLPHINLETISLLGGGTGCTNVDSNLGFAIYQFPVTTCGTTVTEEPGIINYINKMTSSYDVGIGPYGSITRDTIYELIFQCRYIGSAVETVIVEVTGTNAPPLPVAALGPITVQLRLANGHCTTKGCNEVDVAYNSFYADTDYPITKVLRDPVYVQVQLTQKTDPNLILTLGRCWTTTTPIPHSLPQWDILTNGCPYKNDQYLSTLVPVGPSSGVDFPTHYRRFIFQMFTFVNATSLAPLQENVYIHCSTAVCMAGPGSSCEPICARKRRHLSDDDQMKLEPHVVVSVGPMIVTASKK